MTISQSHWPYSKARDRFGALLAFGTESTEIAWTASYQKIYAHEIKASLSIARRSEWKELVHMLTKERPKSAVMKECEKES